MPQIVRAVLLSLAAAPLGGCCAIARSLCGVPVPLSPPRASRDSPAEAVDFLVDAIRRRAPGEVFASLDPDFVAANGGFSFGEFATGWDRLEQDFRDDAERLARAVKDPPEMQGAIAWVFVHDATASVRLAFRNRPAARVTLDDPELPEIAGVEMPDVSRLVSVEGDDLVVAARVPLHGHGGFVDPARVRRVEFHQDWLLVDIQEPRNIRFVDRMLEEMKGASR